MKPPLHQHSTAASWLHWYYHFSTMVKCINNHKAWAQGSHDIWLWIVNIRLEVENRCGQVRETGNYHHSLTQRLVYWVQLCIMDALLTDKLMQVNFHSNSYRPLSPIIVHFAYFRSRADKAGQCHAGLCWDQEVRTLPSDTPLAAPHNAPCPCVPSYQTESSLLGSWSSTGQPGSELTGQHAVWGSALSSEAASLCCKTWMQTCKSNRGRGRKRASNKEWKVELCSRLLWILWPWLFTGTIAERWWCAHHGQQYRQYLIRLGCDVKTRCTTVLLSPAHLHKCIIHTSPSHTPHNLDTRCRIWPTTSTQMHTHTHTTNVIIG